MTNWLIEGYPKVILFNLSSAKFKLEDWKEELSQAAGILIPPNDAEGENVVLFGFMVAIFLNEVRLDCYFFSVNLVCMYI
jgi:glycogen(starch) synthase